MPKITRHGGSEPPVVSKTVTFPEPDAITVAAQPESVEVTEWDGKASSPSTMKSVKSARKTASRNRKPVPSVENPSAQDQMTSDSADSTDGPETKEPVKPLWEF
jgi:hypothetical protein